MCLSRCSLTTCTCRLRLAPRPHRRPHKGHHLLGAVTLICLCHNRQVGCRGISCPSPIHTRARVVLKPPSSKSHPRSAKPTRYLVCAARWCIVWAPGSRYLCYIGPCCHGYSALLIIIASDQQRLFQLWPTSPNTMFIGPLSARGGLLLPPRRDSGIKG